MKVCKHCGNIEDFSLYIKKYKTVEVVDRYYWNNTDGTEEFDEGDEDPSDVGPVIEISRHWSCDGCGADSTGNHPDVIEMSQDEYKLFKRRHYDKEGEFYEYFADNPDKPEIKADKDGNYY